MNCHQIETLFAIALILQSLGILYFAAANATLKRKNEAQRQLLEAPPVPKKPLKPSRIRIYVPAVQGTPVSHVVYGTRLQYPDEKLLVLDDDDKLSAAFGPGWIAAIVEQEPQNAKTPVPKPIEPPKETT